MENAKKRIAVVRGDSYSEWESAIWERMAPDFDIVSICARNNVYNLSRVKVPVERLVSSSDNFLYKNFFKYFFGQYKRMFGLEKKLQNFDVVQTAEVYNYYTLQAVRAKKLNPKLKVVTNFNDNTCGRFEYNYWPGFKSPPSYWRKQINDIVKECADGVDLYLAVTEYSAEVLKEYGVKEEKIEVLGPPILLPEGYVKNKEALLKKMLLNENDKIYLMVNRLVKEKGVYDALYAWKMFWSKDRDPNKKLLIIGEGQEGQNLKRMAKEFDLNTIRFIPSLPNAEVRELYSYAHCLILGSIPNTVWQEQYGYVLAEAIYALCPVISTYSGAIPETVGKCGKLVSPANPIELGKALTELENPEEYAKLKQECEKRKHLFSFNFYYERLKTFYSALEK